MSDPIVPEDLNLTAFPLDKLLFDPTPEELHFLKKRLSEDENTLREKIFEIQEEAYSVFPYSCIRGFQFVSLIMSINPIYSQILDSSNHAETILLDLGCCMGSDLRKLIDDGYPSQRVVGCDIRQEFFKLGHKLYNDADNCPVVFLQGNILNMPINFPRPTPSIQNLKELTELQQLQGRVNHVYTGAFFHLFNEETQHAIALRLAWLVRRETGSIIFGRHEGLPEEGVIDDGAASHNRYGHSPESWSRSWKNVFAEIEGKEFAETRIVIQSTLSQKWISPYGSQTRFGLMWSVQIV